MLLDSGLVFGNLFWSCFLTTKEEVK